MCPFIGFALGLLALYSQVRHSFIPFLAGKVLDVASGKQDSYSPAINQIAKRCLHSLLQSIFSLCASIRSLLSVNAPYPT